MVIAISRSVSICPRCSLQVPGVLTPDDDGYFVHCVSCGYVIRDWGYRRPSYRALFPKSQAARNAMIDKRKSESPLVTLWRSGVSEAKLCRRTKLPKSRIHRYLYLK
jgi:Zn ribbon nucleic-acid-binding protein